MRVTLDADSAVPLYHQLAEALRYRIATGVLPAGASLPALRDAAAQLRVNLHTVRKAYEALAAQGLVETRVPFGTRVLPLLTARGNRRERDAFVAQVVARARLEFGLSPRELARVVAACPRTAPRSLPVHVLECSETQAADLAAQLAAAAEVNARPWSLSRAGEPPEGALLATYFHHNDVRLRWPHRAGDIHFVAIRPSPGVVARLEVLRGGRASLRVVLCEREATMAANIATDLGLLLPRHRFELETALVSQAGDATRLARRGAAVLLSPRLWGELPERARAVRRVLEARYVLDPQDLSRVAERAGWTLRTEGEEVVA